jgi:stage II sporulation protein R
MNFEQHSTGDSLRVTVKYTAILICFFMILMMAWEGQKTDAAVAEITIPQESIRLRILANSDGPQDQLVKRQLRDAVVAQMNEWVSTLEDPQSLDQARSLIRSHLPELNELVGVELAKRGIDYGYNVELGVVPFPTKLYGGTVYPAGDYEAVRITLGEGKGQNWWCVLFPPLCFIDAGSGDAAADSGKKAAAPAPKAEKLSAEQSGQSTAGKVIQTGGPAGAATVKASAEPEVRFFVWEVLQNVGSWISGLWS